VYRHLRQATAKTRPRRRRATGQGLVEYALIIAIVAVLAIGASVALGGGINGALFGIGGQVENPNGGGAPTDAPSDYNNEADCEANGYYWENPPGPNNSFCTTPPAPDTFTDDDDCRDAGYYWINPPGNNNSYCSATPPTPESLNDDDDCRDAGYYWIDPPGSNNSYCSATPPAPSSFNDDDDCRDAGYYWIDPPGNNNAYCSATPPPAPTAPPMPTQPPAPQQIGHTVGTVCDNWFGEDPRWHWDTPVWHPYTFDSTPAPGHWENGFWSGGWDCRF
jgi:Flp pilus assembly pilin Flp